MSTRGLIGFVVGGEIKSTYNHSDSYPDGLGLHTLKWLREHMDDRGLAERAASIELIDDEQAKPTPEHMERAKAYACPAVGGSIDKPADGKTIHTYYQLLREAQGDLQAYLEVGLMPDGRDFADSSLFCEWAYLVNLDDRLLEVYTGFQESDHRKGRFGRDTDEDWELERKWWREERQMEPPGNRYYPIALVAEFGFDNLPNEATFLQTLERFE